jgi:hypothetical protein
MDMDISQAQKPVSFCAEQPAVRSFARLSRSCSPESLDQPIEEIQTFLRDPELGTRMLGANIPNSMFSFEEALLLNPIMQVTSNARRVEHIPIQKVALPITLSRRDMIGITKTGSGKTAAFAIPAVLHCKLNQGAPWPEFVFLRQSWNLDSKQKPWYIDSPTLSASKPSASSAAKRRYAPKSRRAKRKTHESVLGRRAAFLISGIKLLFI